MEIERKDREKLNTHAYSETFWNFLLNMHIDITPGLPMEIQTFESFQSVLNFKLNVSHKVEKYWKYVKFSGKTHLSIQPEDTKENLKLYLLKNLN